MRGWVGAAHETPVLHSNQQPHGEKGGPAKWGAGEQSGVVDSKGLGVGGRTQQGRRLSEAERGGVSG